MYTVCVIIATIVGITYGKSVIDRIMPTIKLLCQPSIVKFTEGNHKGKYAIRRRMLYWEYLRTPYQVEDWYFAVGIGYNTVFSTLEDSERILEEWLKYTDNKSKTKKDKGTIVS